MKLFRRGKEALRRFVLNVTPSEVVPYVKHLKSRGRYLTRNVRTVRKIDRGDVIVLAPHPDDEVIGVGGTILMHLAAGSKVTVLYLTDGRYDSPAAGVSVEDMIQTRIGEAESVGKEFGLKQMFLNKEDRHLRNDDTTVTEVAEILVKTRPHEIYVPSFFDYHVDHVSTNCILCNALQESRIATPIISGYEVWNHIPYANLFVDISSTFEEKLNMLGRYATPLMATDYVGICRHRAQLHNRLNFPSSSAGYAEAFCSFEPDAYCELLHDYLEALTKFRGNLPEQIFG